MEIDTENRKLELEERRFKEEMQWKNRELDLSAKEIELREKEVDLQQKQFEEGRNVKGVWSQVFSPVGVAVIVGLLGLIGTAVSGLLNVKIEREKQEASLVLKMSEITDDKRRASNLLFFAQVGYLNFDEQRIAALSKQAGLNPGDQAPPPSVAPTTLVEVPKNLNQGLTSAKYERLMEIFGPPGARTQSCSPISNAKLQRLMVTENVGPFPVTGIKPAVDALRRIFAAIKQQKPELYTQIQSGGMLCCRSLRGEPSKFSNHSWGTAIDLQIGGEFDVFGDQKTQSGLIELYPFFNKEKFFWGAESEKREDSMHFEASNELITEWQQSGILSQQ